MSISSDEVRSRPRVPVKGPWLTLFRGCGFTGRYCKIGVRGLLKEQLTLEYEPAFNAICSDIAMVARACRSPRVISAAKIAADAITDAFHNAAGDPDNPRWSLAFTRLAEFLKASPASTSPAFVELQRFLNENVAANHEALLATDPSEQEGGAVVLARQLQPDC